MNDLFLYVGAFAAVTGVISVFKPVHALGIKTRGMGVLALVLGAALIFFSSGPPSITAPASAPLVKYELHSVDDISTGFEKRLQRFRLHVVVKEPADTEQLQAVVKAVVEDAKEKRPFNAVVVFLYDYPEYVGHGMTLGKAEYAPGGEWADSGTVKTGNYKTMEYAWGLLEKDWDKRLTQDEVDVWSAWWDLCSELDKTIADGSKVEQEATARIAKDFSITEEQVKNIIMKQTEWSIHNKK